MLLLWVWWADGNKSESWERGTNIPPILHEKVDKGEKEKMVTGVDVSKMYGVKNSDNMPSDRES